MFIALCIRLPNASLCSLTTKRKRVPCGRQHSIGCRRAKTCSRPNRKRPAGWQDADAETFRQMWLACCWHATGGLRSTCTSCSLPQHWSFLSIAMRTGRDACARRVKWRRYSCERRRRPPQVIVHSAASFVTSTSKLPQRRLLQRLCFTAPGLTSTRTMADTKASANEFVVVIAIDASQQAEYAIKCEYILWHACACVFATCQSPAE